MTRGGLYVTSDWMDAVFAHYEIQPELLVPNIPFELDTFEDRAFLSVVTFSMRRLRFGPLRSFSEHPFLNFRTYVRHQGRRGIYILSSWLAYRTDCFFARRAVPAERARHAWSHDPRSGVIHGRAVAIDTGGEWEHHAALSASRSYAPPVAGTAEHFLLERYELFYMKRGHCRSVSVEHEPWPQARIDLRITADSLIRQRFLWFDSARFSFASFSPGVSNARTFPPQPA